MVVDPDVLLGRRPGGVFYRYTPEGRLVLAALPAVLRNGTRLFRDLDTGEEFRESGFYRWQVTPAAAREVELATYGGFLWGSGDFDRMSRRTLFRRNRERMERAVLARLLEKYGPPAAG